MVRSVKSMTLVEEAYIKGRKSIFKTRVYSFDMEEEGIKGTPRALPKSSKIQFTVFANETQMKKADLFGPPKIKDKIRVEGELALDIPMDDCPGEIGVIALKIEIMPPRISKKRPDPKEAIEVDIDTILISDEMASMTIKETKWIHQHNYARKHRTIEIPMLVNAENNYLIEGYADYLVAKDLEIKTVPVIFVNVDENGRVRLDKNGRMIVPKVVPEP